MKKLNNKKHLIPSLIILFLILGFATLLNFRNSNNTDNINNSTLQEEKGGPEDELHPLSIKYVSLF